MAGQPNALAAPMAGPLPEYPQNRLLEAPPSYGRKTRDDLEASMPNQYMSKLAPEQMPAFQAYVANLAQLQGRAPEHVMRDAYDYDLQGAFLAGLQPDERGHLADTYKKPNHPTLSNQSVYNGQGGLQGGRWDDVRGVDRFTPGSANYASQGGPAGMQQYFNEREPGVLLNMQRPGIRGR